MNLRKLEISLLLAALLALLGGLALSQPQQDTDSSSDNQKSLGEIAKESRKKAASHAPVLTEEDIKKQAGPLPKIELEDKDNADEILQAIADYKAKHTPEQTEQALRTWYDYHDNMLVTALTQNRETAQRRQFTTNSGYWICQDSPSYQNCSTRQMQEMRGQQEDQADMYDNSKVISRVQQTFIRVRNGLYAYNLHYAWFKIRNGNGVGSF